MAKCEYFSAGGSVKDRIALRMIQEAEKDGLIKPGDTLIEPTSGNTGVGICMAGAVLGYKVIICLPKKMSGEKVNTMQRLGATILRTPTEAAWNAPDSHITLSARLQKAIPNSYVLDQYKNKGNPLAHYEGTWEEIIEQTGGDFTHIVMSAGTGGTLTGTAKKIKEKLPHVKVVGIDPVGSILAKPDSMNDHKRLEAYQVGGIAVRSRPRPARGHADRRLLRVGDGRRGELHPGDEARQGRQGGGTPARLVAQLHVEIYGGRLDAGSWLLDRGEARLARLEILGIISEMFGPE